jgi:hypothetical protein
LQEGNNVVASRDSRDLERSLPVRVEERRVGAKAEEERDGADVPAVCGEVEWREALQVSESEPTVSL